jgi:hypothetical protein
MQVFANLFYLSVALERILFGTEHYDMQKFIDSNDNLAAKIETGKIAIASLRKMVEKQLFNASANLEFATEVRSKNGRHLFTWRKDTNNNISITFPKDIRAFIDRVKLEHAIKDEIEKQLANIE